MRDFSFYNNTLKHFLYNYPLAEFYTLHRLVNKNNFSAGVYRRIMFCLSSDKTNQRIARDKIPHKYLKNVTITVQPIFPSIDLSRIDADGCR